MRQSDWSNDLTDASEAEDDADADIARKEAQSMLRLLNQVTPVDQAHQPPANAVQVQPRTPPAPFAGGMHITG